MCVTHYYTICVSSHVSAQWARMAYNALRFRRRHYRSCSFCAPRACRDTQELRDQFFLELQVLVPFSGLVLFHVPPPAAFHKGGN